jgi:uncharacterized protein YbjT (DUF2867 family)
MPSEGSRQILVTGATGFIGQALVRALVGRGKTVICASRKPKPQVTAPSAVEWRQCDLLQAGSLADAMVGVDVAYYLVHSMGSGQADYGDVERRAAEVFVDAAARSGVERIVYLGGPAPSGRPSEHLRSRLRVGEILRAGVVPTVELRASMVIGNGSISWQIVRDLGMRLPIMILPRWLKSRTCPVAIDDVVTALIAAATMTLAESTWFDIPGPEVMTGREILERIGALRGRQIIAIEIPLLTPQLSALWLKLVTRADFAVARELVLGLSADLLPRDARFWQLIGHSELLPFDEAARRALMSET